MYFYLLNPAMLPWVHMPPIKLGPLGDKEQGVLGVGDREVPASLGRHFLWWDPEGGDILLSMVETSLTWPWGGQAWES